MIRTLLAILVCAGVYSLATGAASAQTASTQEIGFVNQAALANMAEIQLGHLAVKKAQQPDVKKFAQMMVDDHLKIQKKLADAAAGESIKWPTQLDDMHRQLQQRLSTLNGDQFDREYMKAMVDGHREVEKMLAARAGDGGSDGAGTSLASKLNKWAADTLPSVRDHLKQAEQVNAGLGNATSTRR